MLGAFHTAAASARKHGIDPLDAIGKAYDELRTRTTTVLVGSTRRSPRGTRRWSARRSGLLPPHLRPRRAPVPRLAGRARPGSRTGCSATPWRRPRPGADAESARALTKRDDSETNATARRRLSGGRRAVLLQDQRVRRPHHITRQEDSDVNDERDARQKGGGLDPRGRRAALFIKQPRSTTSSSASRCRQIQGGLAGWIKSLASDRQRLGAAHWPGPADHRRGARRPLQPQSTCPGQGRQPGRGLGAGGDGGVSGRARQQGRTCRRSKQRWSGRSGLALISEASSPSGAARRARCAASGIGGLGVAIRPLVGGTVVETMAWESISLSTSRSARPAAARGADAGAGRRGPDERHRPARAQHSRGPGSSGSRSGRHPAASRWRDKRRHHQRALGLGVLLLAATGALGAASRRTMLGMQMFRSRAFERRDRVLRSRRSSSAGLRHDLPAEPVLPETAQETRRSKPACGTLPWTRMPMMVRRRLRAWRAHQKPPSC